ncbi:MAG: excinuclease ABC subunit C, partial [Candidatus Cloacimonetes bacterium]|nr:excinuclease ABC subunit C [Candidatus Cloacimonadota bacterium]
MSEVSKKIIQKLVLLPDSPGVYLMKNSGGKIIYVGKAKILKNRVRSYFSGTPVDVKTRELVTKISDFEYILTITEEQALVLESNLIKKHRPKYNISLKDDKKYPFIKITINEPFPRMIVTRDLQKDNSRYFGPYTDARAMKQTLRLMEWIFPLRTCKRKIIDGKPIFKRACMNYQLGKCFAPCIGKIKKEDYSKIITNAINFLNGRNKQVVDNLHIEMKEKSGQMQFEEAAKIRDRIENIQKLNRARNMYFTDEKNRDVIGIYREDKQAAVAVLKILSGKLLNKEIYSLDNVEGSKLSEQMGAFLKQYYFQKIENLPFRILLQIKPDDYETINRWLRNKLIIPQRGEKKVLITIA